MHRHVEGRESLLLDATPIGGGKIGEGELGAVEKTQAEVVILEIERAPMARGLLIDETKGAVIVALAETVEERLAKHQPQPVVRLLLQFDDMKHSFGILHFKTELFLTAENLQIDQIARTDAIDAQQPISTLKPQLLSDRAGLDGHHLSGRGEPRSVFPRGALERNASRGLNPHARSGAAGLPQFEGQRESA
jgi:hypothetical protein